MLRKDKSFLLLISLHVVTLRYDCFNFPLYRVPFFHLYTSQNARKDSFGPKSRRSLKLAPSIRRNHGWRLIGHVQRLRSMRRKLVSAMPVEAHESPIGNRWIRSDETLLFPVRAPRASPDTRGSFLASSTSIEFLPSRQIRRPTRCLSKPVLPPVINSMRLLNLIARRRRRWQLWISRPRNCEIPPRGLNTVPNSSSWRIPLSHYYAGCRISRFVEKFVLTSEKLWRAEGLGAERNSSAGILLKNSSLLRKLLVEHANVLFKMFRCNCVTDVQFILVMV